jgi:branched-chain amino acid transport system permease protein
LQGVLNRTVGRDILPPLLVTFGLSVVMQNAMLEGFPPTASAGPRRRAGNRLGRWGA